MSGSGIAGDPYIKDPDNTLDYTIDFSRFLGSDTVSSVAWVVGAGITNTSTSNTTTTATIWLSGGTAGNTYAITARITTASTPARIKDQTIYIKVDSQ